MTYIDPERVLSPKKSVRDVKVAYNSSPEQHSWSVARLLWNGDPRVGIRWNGSKKEKGSKGNPQSSGHSTWFIVPPALGPIILKKAGDLARKANKKLATSYREMARDKERESEIKEWLAEGSGRFRKRKRPVNSKKRKPRN